MMTLGLLLLLLQTVPAGKQPLAPPGPAQEPKATVRGHVYALDTGAPLKRVQVSLRAVGQAGRIQGPGDPGLSVNTDAQGAFEFQNVEAGSYQLSGNMAGYVPASYGQKGPNQPPATLTLRPGQEIKDVDFRLVRGGVIAGTVLDEDGEPVTYVSVQVMSKMYRRGQVQLMPRGGGSTDDRGQYRIFNLRPGRYYVGASPRNFMGQPGGYAPIFYPNARSIGNAQRIEVASGAEITNVNFRLQSVPTFTVSGHVLDQQTGKPFSDGSVNAGPADMPGFAFSSSSPIRADGSFQVRGLMPGRYRLTIAERGGGGMAGRPVMRFFELGSANIENLVVTAGPGVSVRGRLTAEGGIVSNAGLGVTLVPKDESFAFGWTTSTAPAINPDLSFEISDVQPGEYDVSVSQGSFSSGGAHAVPGPLFYVREVRVSGQAAGDASLTVPEGAALPEIEVVLAFESGTVSGRVVDDAGEAVSGAQIALVSTDPKKRASDRYFRSATADQNGNYSVLGVIPGGYLAVVWPESDIYRIQDPDLFAQLEKHAVAVSVEKSATLNQDLKLTTEIKTIARNFAE